jgi:hypothetical protein
MDSPLLFVVVGAVGWPLLTSILCHYQFMLSGQWTLRWMIFVFGMAALAAIGLGDSMVSLERAGQSSASLLLMRGIVFAFPYLVLAVWIGIRFFVRVRHERSTPTIEQCDGADREPPYYPALHEFNPSIHSHARARSRQLILFSLGGVMMQLSQFVTFAGLIVATLMSGGCDRAVRREPKGRVFRIVATDSGFEAPAGLAAGMRHIIYENHGSNIHEAMLVRLAKGMTPDDYQAEVKKGESFPKGALDYSGPGLTSPGQTAEMWLKVDPGNYVLICWNHPKTVRLHPFRVEDVGATHDQPPKVDLVLKLIDYRFELSHPLRKGTQVIRVETPGPSMHELDFFRLHEGQTAADVHRWSKEKMRDQAPFDALGGALDSHDLTRVVWLRKEFSPGRYVLHCEMPIANSKLAHDDVGMIQEIEIR